MSKERQLAYFEGNECPFKKATQELLLVFLPVFFMCFVFALLGGIKTGYHHMS